MELNNVRIGVENLDEGVLAYESLLGLAARGADGVARFQLERGAIELQAGDPEQRSLGFVSVAIDHPRTESMHGVVVRIEPRHHPAEQVRTESEAVVAIDHVVIQTTQPERAIALWCDTHDLRLAFDKEFPQRGLRLLFFRSAGITLEYAAPYPPAPSEEPDRLYGLSYRVASIEQAQLRLRAAGVDVSEVRPGHRADSLVCTVRSGTCGVPTLLIERTNSPSPSS